MYIVTDVQILVQMSAKMSRKLYNCCNVICPLCPQINSTFYTRV